MKKYFLRNQILVILIIIISVNQGDFDVILKVLKVNNNIWV